jgi:hypothetical protein
MPMRLIDLTEPKGIMDDKQIDGLNPHQSAANAAEGQRELAEHARASARRRFIKGTAAASPVLLSLVSRPVMGAARFCSASGFLSGNLSQPQTSDGCGGLSPGYYKNHSPWPLPYLSGTQTGNGNASTFSGGTKFHPLFATGKYNYGTKSMLEVLWTEPGSFAFHTIAALLNAASGLYGTTLTTTQVIEIWNQIMSTGYYLTSNGLQMYESDAKAFFENTYH